MKVLLLSFILFTCNLGELTDKMADHKNRIRSFLNTIKKVESSNGQNFEHPTMQSGIHKGESGMGNYGLMPNTVNEVLNRLRIEGKMTPELNSLNGLEADQMKGAIETHPELEDQIAEHLADRVLTRQPNDDMAAYSLNHGHNLTPERIQATPYQDSDYVKKYELYKKQNDEGEDNGN